MSASAHGKHSVKPYLFVFGALMVLTVVTVAVSYWHLPPGPAIGLGLAIASLKAALVAAVFMHLKGEKGLIYFFLGVTAFFLIVLFSLPMWDFADLGGLQRWHKADVAHQGPPHHTAPAGGERH